MERLNWTHENLRHFGIPPVIRWLIHAAHIQSTITYSKVAECLVSYCGFTEFETMARKAGSFLPGQVMPLVDSLGLREPEIRVPPLNVLMVSATGPKLPSIGICRDLANWYATGPENDDRLESNVQELRNKAQSDTMAWRRMCRQAMYAVYQYPNWQKIYQRLFPERDYDAFSLPNLDHARAPQEPDGTAISYGGEGDEHRRLKEWVAKHPEIVDSDYCGRPTSAEFLLKSGDWVDVAIFLPYETIVAVEVKSRISNEADLERGIYQCIKYRAVLKAMGMESSAVLVTEPNLPSNLVRFSRTHKVAHLQVRRHGQGYAVLGR